ncbi:transmembrane protein 199-like [Uloborus diversus]|uniref:transmembrane protein 199-like n=1 Tax=Uloborus diversus TaxID=327109 RepID=UPI00240A90C4|nr:transmembrane protein 199-like [Uloborus diversus]
MGFEDIIIFPKEEDVEVLDTTSVKKIQIIHDKKGFKIDDFISVISDGHLKNTFLHEFLEGSEIDFLQTPPIQRNPELAARVEKLKAEQANAEYRKMTKTISPQSKHSENFRDDIKAVTSQVTAIINFVLSIGGSFFFAYKAVEYALPQQNIPAQVLMGIITSTVVALADLYFLARTI